MGILILFFGLVIFAMHLFFTNQQKTKKYVIEILLSYFLFFGLGIQGIISFAAHVFFPYAAAELIGWKESMPFQYEIGIANLSFGVLAVLCVFIRMKHFWLAAILGNTIFLWGAAIGHIRQIILYHNFASGNAGLYFFMDILYPIIAIGLYIWLMLIKKEKII